MQSNDWVRVRIQQMEPDLMEVGSNLEEAKQLRREHDDLLYKLGVSQLTHDVIASPRYCGYIHVVMVNWYCNVLIIETSDALLDLISAKYPNLSRYGHMHYMYLKLSLQL